MNIQERIMLFERVVKELDEAPTERSSGSLVANVMVSALDNDNQAVSDKKHFAKLVVDPRTFMDTFAPDDDNITVSDASFFGYELRRESNGVLVDCLMTKEQLKAFYGDIKLARIVPAASRLR